MTISKITTFIILVLVMYLCLWPVQVDPVSWKAPKSSGYTGVFAQNNNLANLELVLLNGEYGPEDLAMNKAGDLYVSMHSGAILRKLHQQQNFQYWVNTQGRPLGIEFDSNGNLVVADAYRGLLSITPDAEINLLTNKVNNTDILYADDVDIAQNGKIYFSDASTKFGAEDSGGTYPASLLDIMEHGGHGRILMYDPLTKETQILASDINFANGVAVSHDQKSLLFNETGHYRVQRLWLQGDKLGQIETVIDNLPGFPDNIAKALHKGYWFGLVSPRSPALDGLSDAPFLRKVVQRLPAFMRPKAQRYTHVVKIDETGQVLKSLQHPEGKYPLATGVWETEDFLYLSSLTADSVARLRKMKTNDL